jgi:hypothetical protein
MAGSGTSGVDPAAVAPICQIQRRARASLPRRRSWPATARATTTARGILSPGSARGPLYPSDRSAADPVSRAATTRGWACRARGWALRACPQVFLFLFFLIDLWRQAKQPPPLIRH